MIWRYLLYAFLIYLAYRFIFHFVIPIYKTTKQVKKQFREMSARMNRSDEQSRMEDHINQKQANQQTATPQPENKKQQAGDYIDFEDVK